MVFCVSMSARSIAAMACSRVAVEGNGITSPDRPPHWRGRDGKGTTPSTSAPRGEETGGNPHNLGEDVDTMPTEVPRHRESGRGVQQTGLQKRSCTSSESWVLDEVQHRWHHVCEHSAIRQSASGAKPLRAAQEAPVPLNLESVTKSVMPGTGDSGRCTSCGCDENAHQIQWKTQGNACHMLACSKLAHEGGWALADSARRRRWRPRSSGRSRKQPKDALQCEDAFAGGFPW